MAYQVSGSRVEWNPTAARLRELTEEMPNASVTEFGNVNVKARVDSRSTRSTYLVDDSTNVSIQALRSVLRCAGGRWRRQLGRYVNVICW